MTPGADWTYIDVMAAALASLDEDRFYADTERWNVAWKEVLESSREAADLLPEVYFVSREPYVAFSDQVEALIRALSRSNVISLGNPRYMFFTMDQEAKNALREQNESLLRTHVSAFDAMKDVLRRRLVVSPA